MMKAALHNLGCKVNAYETEAMQELLEQQGYKIVPFKEGADVYIINTCTVTNIADRKSRQMLRRAKKMNPDAIVVAAGCYVQAHEQDVLKAEEYIDIVLGNNRKHDVVAAIEEFQKENNRQEQMIDIAKETEYEPLRLSRAGGHTRAYIKVQDGCNQFCTYCIIPYARGRVRSRRMNSVVDEVANLAANGYKEVVLTGIHLSSYGIDLNEEKADLLSLIQVVSKVPGIERIRLGSLEPRIITEEFALGLSRIPEICPHFHLSLQSGSDSVLKRMNRRYDSAEYEAKCQILRKYFENPALTTDVIVGFPGETEEEFETTKAFVEKIGFYEIHVFKYSRRQNTKAAVMPDQIDEEIKSMRSNTLLAVGRELMHRFERQISEREIEVLIEEQMQIDGADYWIGYTKEYVKVALKSAKMQKNQTIRTRINEQMQIVH